jgi:hypothetical protein
LALGAMKRRNKTYCVVLCCPDHAEIQYLERVPTRGMRLRDSRDQEWVVDEALQSGRDTYTVSCVGRPELQNDARSGKRRDVAAEPLERAATRRDVAAAPLEQAGTRRDVAAELRELAGKRREIATELLELARRSADGVTEQRRKWKNRDYYP